MRLFLDIDRTPTGVTILHQGTFFSRDIELPDQVAADIENVLNKAAEIRKKLKLIYEQSDARMRSKITDVLIEDMIALCDGTEKDEKPSPQVSEVASSKKSRGRPKKQASSTDTSQKIV